MDGLPIPEDEIVPLDHVAAGLTGIRTVFVNVYAVSAPNSGWVLIDAGIPLASGKIKSWAESHFGEGTTPSGIILTHGHFDHVGSLEALLEHWNVPVYAHPAELPYLTGQQKYPPPDPGVGGGLMAIMSPLYPRSWVNLTGRVQPLPADSSVPFLPDWRWLHTPGHASGHISLFRDKDRTLIVGDAFCTTKQESFLAVAKQRPELTGPPAYYTPDWEAARSSVKMLAGLSPKFVAPGHGLPIAGDEVAGQLDELADNFETFGMPAHGKYVNNPA